MVRSAPTTASPELSELLERLTTAMDDREIVRLSAGLEATFHFVVDDRCVAMTVSGGRLAFSDTGGAPDVVMRAAAPGWARLLAVPPPPTFHSFTALQMANACFDIAGEPIAIARARPVLERIVEVVVKAQALDVTNFPRDLTRIRGRYVNVAVDREVHGVYVESAGNGIPILFLHTAGADARQFLDQMSDLGLGEKYEMFAVDLPFHGRSMPPRSWDGGAYKLTQDVYFNWCRAILDQVVGAPALIVGGSMGAAMSLVLAAECPGLVRGVVAVEPPFRSKGRRNPFQHHAGVHGALHNSSYVRGLMSPLSPQTERRRAAWIYSQGAPGIYAGDLAFYSDEFDGERVASRVNCAMTPVVLLCGSYDYSATPADGAKLQERMPGSELVVMEGLGHFPMCENADLFRPYLTNALDFILAASVFATGSDSAA